jgi:hypothetical protein
MNNRLRRALLGGCSVAATLVVAGSASAGIVVDRSIDGVRLGSTTGSVRKLLGPPRSIAPCSVFTVCSPVPESNPGTVSWTYGKQSRNNSYVFIEGRVALMGSFETSERTAAGVGPGTSLKVAKQRYPKLAFHRFLPGRQPSGYYISAVPTKTGDDFTMLVVASGRVDWVEIGRWNNSSRYVCDFSICS